METNMHRRHFLAASSATALSWSTLPVMAQTYPDRAIKLYQGFAAGGNADSIARAVGTEIGKALGQPVIVEAQTGAGGTIAATTVARAKPDGYTLLMATGGHAVAGALYNKLPYNSVSDFEMISTVTFFPFLLVVNAKSKFQSLREVLARAQAEPGTLAYGTAGVGSTHHLAGELLAKLGRVSLMHVPYRGDAAAVTALLGMKCPSSSLRQQPFFPTSRLASCVRLQPVVHSAGQVCPMSPQCLSKVWLGTTCAPGQG